MTTPLPAFTGGCHVNKAVDDAYATGGFPAVFKLPNGIYSTRDAGCRAFIDRFPGTRFGEPPTLAHFLRCADNGYVNVVKGMTGFSLFRKRSAWTVYLRGLSDLPQSNPAESLEGDRIVMRIIAILRRAGAKCIVEGTPQTYFEKVWLGWFIQAGLFAGTEPWWDRGATELFKYPSITEERALVAQGSGIDGSGWPTNWRPFPVTTVDAGHTRFSFSLNGFDGYMLLMDDRNPGTLRDRIATAESFGWQPVPYCHQWAAAQGITQV